MLDVGTVPQTLLGLSPLDIQARHDEAFDVEAVTKQFFDQYQAVFRSLQADLQKQTRDAVWAHDYALQFLNRLMFLYFVQRKRWLGEDTEFLRAFWEAYQDSKQPKNSFFADWLSVLFFEAFNNRFHGGHRQFPDPIRKALQMAPYLNGGLFRENRLDTSPPRAFTITDGRFEEAYEFLESYNFTIAEDSPLDQEVAVDPEMIGKVYESLVNVSSEADERGDAGIFYTPRTEIDLMCRLALVDNLANHLGQQHKNLLYEVVFALEPEDKEAADNRVQAAGLWDHLNDRLQETTVVDPACGSGSFLVGMLHILDDLQARAARRLGTHEDPYDRKKRIIGQSLYGVDVMEWACHVAELRLWLALIIDADIDTTAAHVRREPLLPHFSFKIRCGDSLVQEVGGLNMAHIKGSSLVPPPVKRKITHHKLEKLRFYSNDEDRDYKTEEQVKHAELQLFREILDAQEKTAEQQVVQLNQRIANPKAKQIRLDGTVETTPQMALEAAQLQRQVEELQAHRERLGDARDALRSVNDVPFVWDIAFVEVFEGDSDGFDIVVGNPPYVRQESIADPREREDDFTADQWRERKKAYKAKLARSVYQAYPRFFRYDPARDVAGNKLNAKSDLYVYFYLHAMSLLNPQGSFAFITSNSWLDVGYGAGLQEWVLRHCHAKLILDNEVRRVFDTAEVNPVIVLFSPPDDRRDWGLEETARFVMFTVPFERIVDAVIFEEIEEATDRKTTADYRVFPISQQAVLVAGLEAPDEDEEEAPRRGKRQMRVGGELVRTTKYSGDTWGGKYLRAPAIYWTISEHRRGDLVRVGDVAEVRFGIKTGANEFFYLDGATADEWGLERRYLRPAVKTPRDYYGIRIPGSQVLMFWCQDERSELRGTAALRYIKWGEAQGFHEVPSCRSRSNWYSLRGPEKPVLLWPSAFFERHIVYECPKRFVADKVFYTLSGEIPIAVRACLNSSVTSLFVEVEGYQLNHGGIFVTTDWLSNLLVLAEEDDRLAELYEAVACRDICLCTDELRRADRRALDARVLELMGLDPAEVLEPMYEAIQSYVAGRIHKARRGTTKKGRGAGSSDDWEGTDQ